MIDINIHGVILGMKLALARMIPRDRGHIVNISSQAGKFGAPGGATYSATKHAVVGLTEAVRGELRLMGAHIDLSYVMPYVVNTELGSGLGEARGMSNLEPSDVADAIVEALQLGHRRSVGAEVGQAHQRARRRAAAPALRGHGARDEGRPRARRAPTPIRRRDYELRASRSEPGLKRADEQPQIASSVGEPRAPGE